MIRYIKVGWLAPGTGTLPCSCQRELGLQQLTAPGAGPKRRFEHTPLQVAGGPAKREALVVGLKNGQARRVNAHLLQCAPLNCQRWQRLGPMRLHRLAALRLMGLAARGCWQLGSDMFHPACLSPQTPLTPWQVVKVFVDNPFPIPLISHCCGVRCLDVSPGRTQLAMVDEASKVVVYDLETKVGGGVQLTNCQSTANVLSGA